jgi:hypothetical protein
MALLTLLGQKRADVFLEKLCRAGIIRGGGQSFKCAKRKD